MVSPLSMTKAGVNLGPLVTRVPGDGLGHMKVDTFGKKFFHTFLVGKPG
jgi:hypothetical protein